MAIFKQKTGGTKVGNTLRAIGSVFKAPAGYTAPKVSINKPSVPKVTAPGASGIGSAVNKAVSNVKTGVSSISPTKAVSSIGGMSIDKPVTKTGTATKNINTGITSGPNQNMSPAIKEPNMSPAFIGPRYSPYGGMSTGGKGGSLTIKSGTTKPKTGTPTYTRTTGTSPNNPITADVMSKTAALGDTFAGSDYGDIGNLYRSYMSGGDIVDSSAIRSRAIADVQDRINALNQVYDQQLSRVQQEGVGRTGETTALLAARGLAGSMRGGAIADLTRTQNRQLEAQVGAERNNAIQGILADANKAAMQEIQSKTEARLGGASALISFLKGSDERKQNYINSVAQNLVASGVDIESMSPEQIAQLTQAAQKAGVSFNNIVAAYQTAKAGTADEGFSLSSGQARYDSAGNLIATNEGAGGGELSPEVYAMAKQVNDGILSIQQVPSALRGAVALAQQSMSNPRVQELDAVISTIDELASNPKLKNILGPVDQAIGGVFGQAATAKNLYNQLTGILALEGRNKLKGSGAISDFEFRVLKEAQSALGRNLNEKEFKKQLNKVRDVLEKRKATLMSTGTSSSVSSTGGGTFAEAW